MKIGIVSNLYPPNERGGAELVAQRVADELYARGHDVFVLTTEPFTGFSSFVPRLRERHLERVYRFCPINLYSPYHKGSVPFLIKIIWHLLDLWSPHARSVMKNLLETERPDVMITHNLKGIGVGIVRAIQQKEIPHVHTLHDLQLSIPSGLLIWGQEKQFIHTSFLRLWYEWVVKKVMGKPNLVLSPSAFLATYYQDRGFFRESTVRVLPNPMPKNMAPLRSRRMPGPARFVYAGQLEPHKGILHLLRSIQMLDVPFELHIAGDGSLADEIAEFAKRDVRIRYHGFIPLNHLARWLAVADAVVVPSLCYENSPTIIYESFAIGVPVIASRIGGIPELISEGENGWLVEPGNENAWAQKLTHVATHQDECWEKTEAIRETAKQFALEHYVTVLEKELERVVDDYKSNRKI